MPESALSALLSWALLAIFFVWVFDKKCGFKATNRFSGANDKLVWQISLAAVATSTLVYYWSGRHYGYLSTIVVIVYFFVRYKWTSLKKAKTEHTNPYKMAEDMKQPICDGCNVYNPWEHKCHGYDILVEGEKTNKICACPQCRELDLEFPKSAIVKNEDNPLNKK